MGVSLYIMSDRNLDSATDNAILFFEFHFTLSQDNSIKQRNTCFLTSEMECA